MAEEICTDGRRSEMKVGHRSMCKRPSRSVSPTILAWVHQMSTGWSTGHVQAKGVGEGRRELLTADDIDIDYNFDVVCISLRLRLRGDMSLPSGEMPGLAAAVRESSCPSLSASARTRVDTVAPSRRFLL